LDACLFAGRAESWQRSAVPEMPGVPDSGEAWLRAANTRLRELLAGRDVLIEEHDRDLNAANLVYERAGDRLGWQVYRFRPSGMASSPTSYQFGPYWRTHGLSHEDFFGQWDATLRSIRPCTPGTRR
jgi:hypothetical protein